MAQQQSGQRFAGASLLQQRCGLPNVPLGVENRGGAHHQLLTLCGIEAGTRLAPKEGAEQGLELVPGLFPAAAARNEQTLGVQALKQMRRFAFAGQGHRFGGRHLQQTSQLQQQLLARCRQALQNFAGEVAKHGVVADAGIGWSPGPHRAPSVRSITIPAAQPSA